MPIRLFLEGEVFEPEMIDVMAGALADACQDLGLKAKENPVVRLLARRIIDEAKQHVHDPELLKAAALRGFGGQRKH